MGAGEITVVVMLIIGGIWCAAKVAGIVWRFVRAPVLSMVEYFVVITSSAGAEEDVPGSGTGAEEAVPPQQHQAAPELVLNFETIRCYLTDHTLTDDELVDTLALLRRSDGNDLLSANKVRDIVGGNEGKVKARVAALRPKAAMTHRPGIPLKRPANGW